MKSHSSFLDTVVQGQVGFPSHKLTRKTMNLPWAQVGTQQTWGGDADLPHAVAINTSSGNLLAAVNNGSLRWRQMTLSDPSTVNIGAGTLVSSNIAMNPSLSADGAVHYATLSSGAALITKRTWGNTVTTFGTIPTTLVDTSNLVIRCESVQVLSSGYLVSLGKHNFAKDLTTINFWLRIGSTWYELSNALQYDLTETYTSQYAQAKWSSWVFAKNAPDGRIVVVFNGSPYGRPMCFTVSASGVESAVVPVIPIDEDVSDFNFWPTGLLTNGSRMYLSGYYRRKMTDGTYVHLEHMLVSADGLNWSASEHASFVASSALKGVAGIGSKWYWIGQGNIHEAPLRSEDGGTSTEITNGLLRGRVNMSENGVAAGDVELDPTISADAGDLLTIESGYLNNTTPDRVAVYDMVVDDWPTENRGGLLGTRGLSLLDKAAFHLNTWVSPIDVDRWSRTVHFDDLKKATKILYKTPQREIANTDSGLQVSGLNRPMVALLPFRDDRDGVMHAQVLYGASSDKCTPSFSFIWGGKDEKYGSTSTLERAPKFKAVAIPRTNNWQIAFDRPVWCESNIDPATGWAIPDHVTNLIETNQLGDYAKLLLPESSGGDATLPVNNAFVAAAGTTYEFSLRRRGMDLFLYRKVADYSDGTGAANADLTLVAHMRYNHALRAGFGGRLGIAAGTDVWADKDAFGNAANDDALLSLSEVTLYNNTYAASYGMTQSLFTGAFWQSGTADGHFDVTTGTMGNVTVGMFLHIIVPGYYDKVVRVKTVGANYFETDAGVGTPSDGVHRAATAYGYPVGTDWATLASGVTYVKAANDAAEGQNIVQESGASAFGRLCGGHGFVVSDDSTAGFNAFYESDGQTHIQKSGYTGSGASYTAFNYLANPLDKVDAGLYAGYGNRDWLWSGSTSRSWRMFFHQSKIFDGAASAKGLADEGFMVYEDEIIRYEKMQVLKRGIYPAQTPEYFTWTVVPSFACSLQGAATPGNLTLTSWWNGSATVGHNLGALYPGTTKHLGLLVRILSRSLKTIDYGKQQEQYYVAGANAGTRSLTLDKVYTGAIVGPAAGKVGGDIALVSGRGQFNTPFTTHPADAPVKLYPLAMSDPPPTEKLGPLVTVKALAASFGLYNALEDDLRATCALAGVHGASFDSRYSYTGTPTNQSTGLTDADFVAEVTFTPGTFTIDFRNYYSLEITTSGSTLYLTFSAPGSSMTASGGKKKLWRVPIPMSTVPAWGSSKFRIIVRNKTIQVEMDGQQLWAFHLELLPAAKIQQTVGTITFTCSASCTMRILDLPDEIDNHMVDMGGTGSQAISEVVRNRHVYSKPTAGGGIKFTRYSTRDNLGTFSEVQLSVNKVVSPFERPTHVQVSGAEIGEAVDQAGSRLYGYRFTQADNPYLDSVTDSARESVLLLDKTSKETTVYRIEMQGLPWGESGDLITHGYSARGDTPGLGNTQMVVRGHNWVFGPEVSRTMLTCRPA